MNCKCCGIWLYPGLEFRIWYLDNSTIRDDYYCGRHFHQIKKRLVCWGYSEDEVKLQQVTRILA